MPIETTTFSFTGFRAMCESAGAMIYDTRQPTERYAMMAGQLLFMTAAHESDGFRARRQYGFSRDSTRGAFGLLQLEKGSIGDSLKMLATRPNLAEHTREYLRQYPAVADIPFTADALPRVLLLLQSAEGDALGVMLARLHYLRVRASIPELPAVQAVYAKRYYNTYYGKAMPHDYLNAWKKFWPA